MKNQAPNQFRATHHPIFPSSEKDGMKGAFILSYQGAQMMVVSNVDEGETDHISISVLGENRKPSRDEMIYIRGLFWDHTDFDHIVTAPAFSKFAPNVVHMYLDTAAEKIKTEKFI